MSDRSYTESRLQQAIVTHFRKHHDGLIFHVGNGGRRSKVEAIRFKSEGVEAGVPDLIVLAPGGRTYFVEVKAPGGSLAPSQKHFLGALRDMLFDTAVVYSLDEAKGAFEAWNLPAKTPRVRSEAELATGF